MARLVAADSLERATVLAWVRQSLAAVGVDATSATRGWASTSDARQPNGRLPCSCVPLLVRTQQIELHVWDEGGGRRRGQGHGRRAHTALKGPDELHIIPGPMLDGAATLESPQQGPCTATCPTHVSSCREGSASASDGDGELDKATWRRAAAQDGTRNKDMDHAGGKSLDGMAADGPGWRDLTQGGGDLDQAAWTLV